MEKVNATFGEFEKQKMTMEMQEEYDLRLLSRLIRSLLDELLEDSSENEEAEEVIGEVLDELNLELTNNLEESSQQVWRLAGCYFSLLGY